MFSGSRYTLSLRRLLPRFAVVATLLSLPAPLWAQTVPDPTLLLGATTSQLPLTAAYNALNVPSIAAGGSYLDPTTGVKIYRLTSASFPTPSPFWGHDYSEGGDEVSLPYNGNTRAVLVRQSGTSGGPWWLIDFTPGVGVSNPRQLTGILSPWIDLAFTFSNNPATPYYAYVSNGSSIIRFDIRTMTEVGGNGWPVTDSNAIWLHQSENDGLFTWMRGVTGPTVVGYEPSTGTLKTYTNSGVNEPRIDRAGRYIGLSMNTPMNGLVVWDWLMNTVLWTTSGDPGIPFAHNASLRDRWVVVDWNLSFPDQFATFTPPVPNSGTEVGGPAPSTTVHGNGNWIQHPASGNLNDQWALFTHYGSLQPTGSSWLAPGGMIFMTPNGQRRLLGHPYNTTPVYNYFSFPKLSSDGKYVMFTSDMDGSGRSDVFLAEVPVQNLAPSVSITAPTAGATVASTITVSANATATVGIVGVQFKLDGSNLGAQVLTTPYSVSWNTATVANGTHILTAVAQNTLGNLGTSAPVSVTVANDTTPPTVSITAPALGATVAATITVAATASDNVGVAGVQFKLDGTNLGAEVTTAPYAISWNTTMVANGAHTLTAVARDAAGNTATSAGVAVTVSNSSTIIGGSTINTGLVGYWAFDEGTGTIATDSSGNGNTGTLVNGPLWTIGKIGRALTFDGLTNYVAIRSTTALNAYPLTVAVWLKTNSAAGVRGIVNKYLAGSYNGYQVFINNGNLCAWFLRDTFNYVYDGSGCPFNIPGYNDNAWHHVAYVVDASGGTLYVDGAQKGSLLWTGTAGAPSTLQDVHVGHYPGAFGGAEYFPGLLDDVRIYNRALSAAEVLSLYTAADSTPPTVSITAPISGATVGGTVTVSATASDNVGVAGVQFKLDGVNLGAEVTTSPYAISWNTPTAANGGHALTAVARDAAGNTATSAAVSVTVANDTTPPTVSITAPASGTTVAGTITVSANATDNVGVVGVQFKLDGSNVGAEVTTAPYAIAWNTTSVANGTHTLTAVARDAAGNTATSAGVAVTVSNTTLQNVTWTNLVNVTAAGNSITKTSGCDGCPDAGATSQQQITSGDGYAEFTASETTLLRYAGLTNGNPGTSGAGIKFAIGLQSGIATVWESGIYRADTPFVTGAVFRIAIQSGVVKYYKNGTLFYTSGVAPTYPLLMDAALNNLNATITNAVIAGTLSTASVDTTPPTVALTAPAAGATVSGTITVSASASDNVGVAGVQFKLDGTNLAAEVTILPYAVSWVTTAGPNGAHTLTAVARDAAGNTATSAPVSVTVANDLSPPIISSVSASNISASGATITWTTNEPSDSQVQYGLTTAYGSSTPVNATLVTAHSQVLNGLAANTWYHYRVKSRDAAGNLAVSADFTFKTTKH